MNKLFLSLALGFLSLLPMQAQTASTKVDQAFEKNVSMVGKQFFNLKGLKPTAEELSDLKFLYAYMTVADMTDYPTSFYLDNVRATQRARKELPWGKEVSDQLYRHFVLPLRVNNENLDYARVAFYDSLKTRVEGLSMKEAILEVNHWCHEHVTYTPSDARTLGPQACLVNALGRCGEQSTFTVAALRAVGIPARQVYTPRWAHTDDNHAWVEAWADGQWWFFGACEPEPVLNLGWFNAPASRAMLTHTQVFGDYDGPEEVVLRTPNFTEVNLIDNYAKTARIDFRVTDAEGKPVSGAKVECKIYNYAEFYTAVTKYTDAEGKTFLSAGLGDLLIWASKDGHFGFTKASFGKDKELTIKLDKSIDDLASQHLLSTLATPAVDSLDIVPPAEHANIPEMTDEQVAQNKLRFAREDSIRKAYEHTFYQGTGTEPIDTMLRTARGNWRTIQAFYKKHNGDARSLALLRTLSDKDLRDMPMEILEDNYLATSDQLCPRVEDEMIISPFKQFFEKAIPAKTAEQYRRDPAKLVAWVKANLKINTAPKATRIAQTPVGVWKSRFTDVRSRDIFFVDVARSLGIEARKDVVTSKVQYKKDGKWIDVNFDAAEQKSAPQGTLKLTFEPTKYVDNPMYYSHFSISKIVNGSPVLLNFDEGQVDMGGGTSWKNTFKNGTPLDCGTYLLITGTRMANGSVKETHQFFTIEEGKTTTLPLVLRSSGDEVSVIGSFSSESSFMKDGQPTTILKQTGRGYYIVGLIGVGQEPTNHTLRDIAKLHEDFNKWGRPLVLLFESEAEAEKFKAGIHAGQETTDGKGLNTIYGTLPENTIFGVDSDGSIHKAMVASMKLTNARQLPIFFIADTFDRIVFCSQGYTIGLGEQMIGTIKKL